MPVIINDFEIEVEPPPGPGGDGGPVREETPAPAPLRPDEVERIVRHFEQRAARLRAD